MKICREKIMLRLFKQIGTITGLLYHAKPFFDEKSLYISYIHSY